MRLPRLTPVAVGILLLAGCRADPMPADAAAATLADLAAEADTVALARLAEQQCRPHQGAERQTCYENWFVALADQGRVRTALGALTVLAAGDREVEANGHTYTHAIGITAWKPGRDVGEAFRGCTGLFQSGCYHGVIQTYLTAEGEPDSLRVAGLCDAIEGDAPNQWLRFQCAHGLGHGLEMAWNWELPRALQGCDWMPVQWDRESCYGGAFMEYAVAALADHAAARLRRELAPGGGEDHAAHGGGGGGGGHHMDPSSATFRMRDSTDLLYPCSIVGLRYTAACYLVQGGVILDLVGYDFAAAMAACDRAPADLRHHCYVSLGTNASGVTVRNPRKAIEACSHGDPGYRPWCFVGVAKNFVDVTADPADGFAFCRQVPAGTSRRQCWVAIGEQIWVLHAADPAARGRACEAAGPPDAVTDCRYGAGLLREPPPGLPLLPPGLAGG